MFELALHHGQEPLRLHQIARSQGIPGRYLEQMMVMLVSCGLVRSTRGRRGGFSLAKPPDTIVLSDVVQAVEGSLALVDCVDDDKLCSRVDLCITHEIWKKVKEAMSQILDSITLADMVEMHNEKKRRAKKESKTPKKENE
jgi:Rrf2 family protein